MYDPTLTSRPYAQPGAPYALPPVLPREALAGVRTRRILAVCIDLIVVSVLAFVLWSVLTVATFGLALLILPSLWPFVAFFYNGFSVSGRHRGTPGMRMTDIEMQLSGGGQRALLHRRDSCRAVLLQLDVPADPARVAGDAGQALPARHLLRRDRGASPVLTARFALRAVRALLLCGGGDDVI